MHVIGGILLYLEYGFVGFTHLCSVDTFENFGKIRVFMIEHCKSATELRFGHLLFHVLCDAGVVMLAKCVIDRFKFGLRFASKRFPDIFQVRTAEAIDVMLQHPGFSRQSCCLLLRTPFISAGHSLLQSGRWWNVSELLPQANAVALLIQSIHC